MARGAGSGGRRLVRRLVQLYGGLVLFGVSLGLMVPAGLGLAPWEVLHQGMSRVTGLTIGTASILTGATVLLAWIPLRERPGLGTVSNVLVIGVAMDATLLFVPEPGSLAVRVPVLVGAVLLNGVATGLYLAARFGAGPRDGLMTGLHRVTGRSVRAVRTVIEVTVLGAGVLLGGTVGVGTVAYALAIGPLSQVFLRVCAVPEVPPAGVAVPGAAGGPRAEPGEGVGATAGGAGRMAGWWFRPGRFRGAEPVRTARSARRATLPGPDVTNRTPAGTTRKRLDG